MPDPLPILVSESLTRAGFAHGFSTRAGGVSEPPYDSLDFALLRDPVRLRENQRRLAARVGFDPGRLFQARQVHGRALLVAAGAPSSLVERDADALVAEPGSGFAVAVRVADCVPVLLGDRATGRVAAAHAGWRGVVDGVLAAAVQQLGGGRSLVAAIGPCIGPCCFEVGDDVATTIARATTAEVIVRRDEAPGKAHVDLRRAVRAQLVSLEVEDGAIDDVPGRDREACTRCQSERFYSYRRDGDASGRLLGVIVARDVTGPG
jgi:YfiH family protein